MSTNRIILVDNATLSGVERLIGASKILNLSNISNDIVCLEKLITAILFSDHLISVDDYKEKYRSERMNIFKFIDFISIDKLAYDKYVAAAAAHAQEAVFEFDGSKPIGDVVEFFETLRINPQLRWNVFGSSEYLTLSLLVNDRNDVSYESAIDGALGHEAADTEAVRAGTNFEAPLRVRRHPEISDVKRLVNALAAGNANFVNEESRSLLRRAVFAYGWVAERSYFYNAVAADNGAEPYLAPLRDAYGESCCRIDSKSETERLIESLKQNTQEALVKIVDASGRAKYIMRLPLFSAYLISKCDNPKQCIEQALQLRGEKDFSACRSILWNLTHLTTAERVSELNRILELMNRSCSDLMKKYAVSNGNGPAVSFSLGVTGPSVGVSFKLDRMLAAYRNRPFSRIFRNIAQDMISVERLGSLYEKLTVLNRRHEKATFRTVSVTPKFMEHKQNEHGGPVNL